MELKDYIDLELECNGRVLQFGRSASGERREFGITKIEGLESSELEVTTTDNALVDGAKVAGKRIGKRVIHLEATLRDDRNNAMQRQRIIKFFNPKHTGTITVEHSGTKRRVSYELEGWTFAVTKAVYGQLSIVVDMTCPDPFFRNLDDFGRNMAEVSRQIAFPWRVVKTKATVPEPYGTLALPGQITGYRSLTRRVYLPNDGDVPAPLRIEFTAERGPCINPKIMLDGSGKFVRVRVGMEKGDVLIVDTDERHQIIELNGVNVYQKIDRLSKPFELEVGNNYLVYDADEDYSNLDVWLYYTPRYLGI